MADRTFFVIIPALNESATIGRCVQGVKLLGPQLKEQGLSLRVLVVDDGSTDDTGRLAEEAGADHVIRHRRNQGLGAAVRAGLEAARSQGAAFAVKFDADLQHEQTDILEILRPLLADAADVVYGDRYSKIDYSMPLIRKWGNAVFKRIMAWLTKWPIRDSQPGIFGVNKDYLAVFELPGDYNYTQQILLDAYIKGMRFDQVSVHFHQRKAGKSFVSLKYPFRVLTQILLVAAIANPIRIFARVGAAFFLFAATIFAVQILFWLLGYSARPVENVNLVMGSALFGVQMMIFGILAKMIMLTRGTRR